MAWCLSLADGCPPLTYLMRHQAPFLYRAGRAEKGISAFLADTTGQNLSLFVVHPGEAYLFEPLRPRVMSRTAVLRTRPKAGDRSAQGRARLHARGGPAYGTAGGRPPGYPVAPRRQALYNSDGIRARQDLRDALVAPLQGLLTPYLR